MTFPPEDYYNSPEHRAYTRKHIRIIFWTGLALAVLAMITSLA